MERREYLAVGLSAIVTLLNRRSTHKHTSEERERETGDEVIVVQALRRRIDWIDLSPLSFSFFSRFVN